MEVAVELVWSLAVGEVRLGQQSITLRLPAGSEISRREVLREVRLLAEREPRLAHHLAHALRARLAVASAEWLTVAAGALRRSHARRHLPVASRLLRCLLNRILLLLLEVARRNVVHVHIHEHSHRHHALSAAVILRDVRNRVVRAEDVHAVAVAVPSLVVLLLLHRRSAIELMVRPTAAHHLLRIVHRIGHEVLSGIERVDNFFGLRELNHRLLHVVQASFDQNFLLLVEVQKVVPQLLLAQHLRVADDDQAVLGSGERHV